MSRWFALLFIAAVASGCTLKLPAAGPQEFDYTDYETYDQPHGTAAGADADERVATSLPENP